MNPRRHASVSPLAAVQPVFPGRLSPLVALLAAALPLLAVPAGAAQPAAGKVPVPAASWRVYGSGGAAPVNVSNSKGGVDQTISQSSQRAIYNWQSFDIGASSSVTFDMAQSGASALNRVTGSASASQIFGKLSATKGGEIYLINANGILFGGTAVVNTGSLIASTLNISDAEFKSGLTNHLLYDPTHPAFTYEGSAADFIDSKNFVRVDHGASITTSDGGRVFLFAKRVENAGTISTPGGQTMLAGGESVYLQNPADTKLYVAQADSTLPTLRGLLVEVGGNTGSVANLSGGVINTPRGNATLVAMAVNQSGLVRATSSVTENGSITLRAQANAYEGAAGGGTSVRASESGELTLGAGSLTTITADTTLNADGSVPTSKGSDTFTNPRIDLIGHSVVLEAGAQVVAPGAAVHVRAENTPSYDDRNKATYEGGDASSRIVIGDGAVIDVSGTTDAEVSVSRYFVTTGLLGSNDLKDAPLQKDGLLYRSQATLDVRDDSLILGSLASYRNALKQTISERLSAGGTVSLAAQGAVLAHANSSIKLKGGQVTVDGAQVRETQLMASNGTLYDLNSAPIDTVYVQSINLVRSASYDRWGKKTSFGSVSQTHEEAGYVEGRAAGSLTVVAPTVVLAGQVDVSTTAGTRQLTGEDSRASGGTLTVGAVTQGSAAFGSTSYSGGPVLEEFSISDANPALDGVLFTDPLGATLPASSGMARALLTSSGFATVAIAAQGDVSLSGAAVNLADQAKLRLLSSGGDVTLGSNLTAHAGTVELVSQTGSVQLAQGRTVDLSGKWLNQLLDGPLDTSAKTGGSFSASGGTGVTLAQGSVVNVSGGAVVSSSGTVSGGDGGSISLKHTADVAGSAPGLVLAGELQGQSLATGASLSLSAPRVLITDDASQAATAQAAGIFTLDGGFFSQGGFSSYTVDGKLALDVASGTRVAPTRDAWTLSTLAATQVATGASLDYTSSGLSAGGVSVATPGLALGSFPQTVALTLSSSGTTTGGALTLAQGSSIELVDQSKLTLSARKQVVLDGAITDHAGTVRVSVSSRADVTQGEATYVWLGEHSSIDVSGSVRATTGTDGLTRGKVLDGGSVSISANGDNGYSGSLVFQEGASINAKGTQAELAQTVITTSGASTQNYSLASAGGSVSFSSNGQLILEGDVALQGGQSSAGTSAKGGSLSVSLVAGNDEAITGSAASTKPRTLTLGATNSTLTQGLEAGQASLLANPLAHAAVSAELIEQAGAADVTLAARESILIGQRTGESVTMNLAGSLTLSAQALAAAASSASKIEAAQISLTAPAPRTDDASMRQPSVQVGNASLALNSRGGLLVKGHWVTQGLGRLDLGAQGDLMLQGLSKTTVTTGSDGKTQTVTSLEGGLNTLANLNLSARQIYPATDTTFDITATGRNVSISGGDTSAEKPLSAGGTLKVTANNIRQGGVVRAPQGSIVLDAAQSLTLKAGSLTSVSAAGLVLPYGSVSGSTWTAPDGSTLSSLPGKRIDLKATRVSVAEGATLDLSAGGDLVGYEFVAGKGGSTDVFAGTDGAYALVPGIHTAASYDTSLSGAAKLGRQIEIGAGGPVPAGVYTLMPARYALQPGAYLIKQASSSTPLALGVALAQADGSTLVGARLRDEGTSFVDALPSTWRIASQTVARKSSEIRTTSANTEFTRRATAAGSLVAERPLDAGTLSVAATEAALDGNVAFATASSSDLGEGRGGRAEFAAGAILVSDGRAAAKAGVLQLSADTLNALGAQTVVLGGTSASVDDSGATVLNVAASSVVFNQGAQTLMVADLLAVSSDVLKVADGAQFNAAQASGAANTQASAYAVSGDGAALRLSAAQGASLVRTGAQSTSGTLSVGANAQLLAEGGSLMLDSSRNTTVAASANLLADDITLAARFISAGGTSAANQLNLNPTLLAKLADAQALTLRAYQQIELRDGVQLGDASLQALVLDTQRLSVANASQSGAQITAGDITLTNTTGSEAYAASSGSGQLSISATTAQGGSGQVHWGSGKQVIDGASQVTLSADQAVLLGGDYRLATAGDMSVATPLISADVAAAQATLKVGGALTLSGGQNAAPTDVGGAVGAALSLNANTLAADARVLLPSGQINVQTQGDASLGQHAVLNVAGRSLTMDGETLGLDGGSISLKSASGGLSLAAGSVVDVSGAQVGSAVGGSLSLSAAQGTLSSQGTLRGQGGAQLSVDSQGGLTLDALAAQLTPATGEAASFSGAITLRQRSGDLSLSAGKTLAAQQLDLSADAGSLSLAGTLDATGSEGGRVALAASGDLLLSATAKILASATSAAGAGGQVSLASTAERIRMKAGSLVDVSAGSKSTQAGRLTLTAARDASNTEVAIDPLAGQIVGAGRIDVQALKLYDAGSSITDLYGGVVAEVASDAQAFIGSDGAGAEAIAQRLAGGNADVLDALRIHAAAELQSTGDLRVDAWGEWAMASESLGVAQAGGDASHVGDTSLTLRAAGNLTLTNSISSGFTDWQGPSDNSGSISLVAGADLSAASVRAVRSDNVGNLTLGNIFGATSVRTTTGEVLLAAANNVNLNKGQVSVSSSGVRSTDAFAASVDSASVPERAFYQNAGDVTVLAGGSVNGLAVYSDVNTGAVLATQPTQWSSSGQSFDGLTWWGANPSLGFQQGVASWGGGQIKVQAGWHVNNLVVASPSSGAWGEDGVVHRYGGGSVSVSAGRDVLNGVVQAGGQSLSVTAGRSIVQRTPTQLDDYEAHGLVLVHEDTTVHVAARDDVTIGSLQSVFGLGGRWLSGLDTNASLSAVATAGDLTWRNDYEPNLGLDGVFFTSALMLLPSQVLIAAPQGSVSFTKSNSGSDLLIQQAQVADSSLSILAGQDLYLGYQLQVNATALADTGAAFWSVDGEAASAQTALAVNKLRRSDDGVLDQSTRDSVHLLAEDGDVTLTAGLRTARPLRMVAGQDISFTQDEAALEIQQQPQSSDSTGATSAAELSSLVAGRDISLGKGSILIGGPGDMVLLAGRDADLGTGKGLIANGNNDNSTLLPSSSAALTVVAGVRTDGTDATLAVQQGFHALGAAGLTDDAADLYAWLSGALGSTPVLGSAAATSFAALSVEQRLAQVKALLGDSAWQSAVAHYVQGLPGYTTQTAAQALAAFDGLSVSLREAAVGTLLAGKLASQPLAQRSAFVTALAQAQAAASSETSTGEALVAWMSSHEGQHLTLAQAVTAFEALPLERQLLWLDKVLVDEVRTYGRAAVSAASTAEQAVAYAKAYAAINTLFPVERPDGDILLPQSTARTLQGGGITLLAPGGGVNAGEANANSAKTANELGIVTVAGGDIASIVRDDFLVNQSRVFTLAKGDILLWSSLGDIDAGRGAKTVVGTPAPVYRLDANGRVVVDTSGSFSGSGIAVLNADSSLDLYAPAGAIDAGEAGIRSSGNVILGAVTVRGADDIKGSSVQGAPVTAPSVPVAAATSTTDTSNAANKNDEEDQRRRKRSRRSLLLEFLGFGRS